MPKDYRRNNREKFSASNTLPTEKSGVRHVGKAVTHTRGRSSVKTVEFKKRQHLGIPLARARPPGPASKPLLGKATTLRKYQDPENRDRLRDAIRGEYGVAPFEGNPLAAILIARFWFQHNCKNYFNYADELRVYRLMLTICERATLIETKQACHRLRSDFNKMKLLMSITGPGLVTIASVTKEDGGVKWLHRLPVPDIQRVQTVFYTRKLPEISEEEKARVLSLVLEKGAGRGYATDKEVEKLPPALVLRYENGKLVGTAPNPARAEALERLANERELRAATKAANTSNRAPPKNPTRRLSGDQINGKQGTFKGNAYVERSGTHFVLDDGEDPHYAEGSTTIACPLDEREYVLEAVKIFRYVMNGENSGDPWFNYDLIIVSDFDNSKHTVVCVLTKTRKNGPTDKYKGAGVGPNFGRALWEALWVCWYLHEQDGMEGWEEYHTRVVPVADYFLSRWNFPYVTWKHITQWTRCHNRYLINQLNGSHGEVTEDDDFDFWLLFHCIYAAVTSCAATTALIVVIRHRNAVYVWLVQSLDEAYRECLYWIGEYFRFLRDQLNGSHGEWTEGDDLPGLARVAFMFVVHFICWFFIVTFLINFTFEVLVKMWIYREFMYSLSKGITFGYTIYCINFWNGLQNYFLNLIRKATNPTMPEFRNDEVPPPGHNPGFCHACKMVFYAFCSMLASKNTYPRAPEESPLQNFVAPPPRERPEVQTEGVEGSEGSGEMSDVDPSSPEGTADEGFIPVRTKRQRRREREKTRRGAGRGKPFVSNSVRYGGQGGRSKGGRGGAIGNEDPEDAARARAVAAFMEEAGEEIAEEEDESASTKTEKDDFVFVYSEFPNCRSTHTAHQLKEALDTNDLVDYDCLGAPYCGFACVDIAIGKKPDRKFYKSLISPSEAEISGASLEQMSDYSLMRGVNLLVMQGENVVHTSENLKSFSWVVLTLLEPEEPEVPVARAVGEEPPDPVGHYVLRVCPKSSVTNILVPEVQPIRLGKGLYGIEDIYTFAGYCTASDNEDVRPVRDRRENVVHQDTYARCYRQSYFTILWGWFSWEVDVFLRAPLDYIERPLEDFQAVLAMRGVEFNILNHLLVWYHGLIARHLRKQVIISCLRANTVYHEMQHLELKDREKALLSCIRLREVNTDASMVEVYSDTLEYMRFVAPRIGASGNPLAPNRGLKAYNAPNSEAYIPDLEVVEENQVEGGAGAGRNHFKRVKLGKTKRNQVIAYAPIGAPVGVSKTYGPGLFALTDTLGVLAGAAGRGMVKDREEVDDDVITEFVQFGKKFFQKFIDETDVSGIEEEDPRDFLRVHYQGKKPKSWIENMCEKYTDHVEGKYVPKFDENGFFVKFENAYKAVLEEIRSRPRNIMKMSDLALMQTSQTAKVTKAFHKTSYSKFHVKNLSLEDRSAILLSATDKAHTITDVSAFESSVFGAYRDLEIYVITQLCKKAGLVETCKAYEQLNSGGRILHGSGVTWECYSRCSGDHDTSFSNGLDNVANFAFCAYKKGIDLEKFEMLAEGDDGIVSPEVPDSELLHSLGFKFSSELQGHQCGDVDFLSQRFVEGFNLLNIPKAFTVFWVKTKVRLKPSKQKFILRCMGNSLHHLSPGHPVLFEVVNRIGRETSGHNSFKGVEGFLDQWKGQNSDVSAYPRDVTVNEEARHYVAEGALGFPPIPICVQLEVERRLREDEVIYLGSLFDDYPIVQTYLASILNEVEEKTSDEMASLLEILKPVVDRRGADW